MNTSNLINITTVIFLFITVGCGNNEKLSNDNKKISIPPPPEITSYDTVTIESTDTKEKKVLVRKLINENTYRDVSMKTYYRDGALKINKINIHEDTIVEVFGDEVIESVVRSYSGKEYYPDGKIKLEYKIVKAKNHGVWKYYSKDGKLIKKEVYNNDELIETKEF